MNERITIASNLLFETNVVKLWRLKAVEVQFGEFDVFTVWRYKLWTQPLPIQRPNYGEIIVFSNLNSIDLDHSLALALEIN